VLQGVTAAAAAEVPAVSGRTVHRGPPVRPGGTGDPEQVQLIHTGSAYIVILEQLVCSWVNHSDLLTRVKNQLSG